MKLSAIQPNYFNKISFKQEENKSQPETNVSENQGMSKNQKITAGVVTAAVALAGLGYLGYKGHLGKGIQKFLGGAEDAAKNLAKESDVNLKKAETPEVPALNKGSETPEIKPEIKTEVPEVKPDAEPLQKPVSENTEINPLTKAETETAIKTEPHKFLSADEVKNLSYSEQTTRILSDFDEIEKTSSSTEEAYANIHNYMTRFDVDDNIFENNITLQDAVMEKMLSTYSEVMAKEYGSLISAKSALAQIKWVKQDYSSAEKLALEIINDNSAEARLEKINAFETLFESAKAQGNKAKAEEIFDQEIRKILNQKKLSDDNTIYLNQILENLSDVFGKDNSTIQAIVCTLA